MNDLELYTAQLNFYNNDFDAWNSLNKQVQINLSVLYPSIFPVKKNKLSEWNIYKSKCWLLTEQNKHLIKDIHLRCFRKFDIDHIVSIYYGYKNNIPIELISSPENLRIIEHIENSKKSSKLTKEGAILLSKWNL